MTTSPHKNHVALVSLSSYSTVTLNNFLLLLLIQLIAQTFGLQQNPAFTCHIGRRPISSIVPKQQICQLRSLAFSSSDAQALDEEKTTKSILAEDQPITYDWDEQLEELQTFMTEYGHCNFPQKPSVDLKLNYPMLERFCQDQRREYKLLQENTRRHERMALAGFDRKVRCRRLEELGFEFNSKSAQWYDSYHELLEYSNMNGHTRVSKSENDPLTQWIYSQRSRRNGAKGHTELSDFQIKLLNDIGFEWESETYDAIWNEKYKELVAFQNQHGNFMMEVDGPLYKWVTHQRSRRAGKKGYSAISDEQIRLLDEIEFPWEPDRQDSKWFARYDELKQFHKEHGHCEPGASTHIRLHKWVQRQPIKKRKGALSAEQIKLLDELDFCWNPKVQEWATKLRELTEYCNTHGHIQVSQEDHPELYDWINTVRQQYHDSRKTVSLSDEKIEQLEHLHFCWALDWRDRVWHEKCTEAVEYFKEHGHVSVTETENPSLYNWIQTQEKRYKGMEAQKPLSEEELEMLEQLEFPFLEDHSLMSWNAMCAKVTKYREENDGRLPTSDKDDPALSRWLRQQRYRYRSSFGYAPLSDEKAILLQSIDLSMYPRGKQTRQWYEKYDELVAFNEKHGHFLVDKPKNRALYQWINQQRMRYNASSWIDNPLSKLQVYLLERIGFTWGSDRYEVEWQQRYDELVEFLETRGHFPTISENKRLYQWLNNQRNRYRGTGTGMELSENQIQKLENIGF